MGKEGDPRLTHHGTCLPPAHRSPLSHDRGLDRASRSAQPACTSLWTPPRLLCPRPGQVFRRPKGFIQGNSLSLVRGIGLWGCLCLCARGSVCLECWAGPQDVSPQACTLLLMVLFIYDIFFVFITPFLTKVGALPLPRPQHCPNPMPHAHSDVALLC